MLQTFKVGRPVVSIFDPGIEGRSCGCTVSEAVHTIVVHCEGGFSRSCAVVLSLHRVSISALDVSTARGLLLAMAEQFGVESVPQNAYAAAKDKELLDSDAALFIYSEMKAISDDFQVRKCRKPHTFGEHTRRDEMLFNELRRGYPPV